MEGDLESLSNRPSDPPSEDAFLDPPVVDENREPIEEYFFEAEVVLTPLQPVAPSHNAVSLVPVVPTLAEDAAERTSGNKSTTELDPTMDTADEQSSWSTGSWRDEPYECAHCGKFPYFLSSCSNSSSESLLTSGLHIYPHSFSYLA